MGSEARSALLRMGSGKGVRLLAIWEESLRDSLGIGLRCPVGAHVDGVRR